MTKSIPSNTLQTPDKQPPKSDPIDTHNSTKIKIKDLLHSVFAAALGVQSSKNRDRDFKQGNLGTFIAAGLIFTSLFIGGVITIVQLVIANH